MYELMLQFFPVAFFFKFWDENDCAGQCLAGSV